jgi:hypothetical protein
VDPVQEGASYSRLRWRQLEQGELPEKVELEVPQPLAAEIYYDTCGRIDQSNRHRQATLKLESKFKVHNWSDRVTHSILGMAIVDTWLVYNQCTQTEEDPGAFYEHLALEMIENTMDLPAAAGRCRRSSPSSKRQNVDSSLTKKYSRKLWNPHWRCY